MPLSLFQPEPDRWIWLIWIALFLIFPFLFYKISYWQILFKLEATTAFMESGVRKAEALILKRIAKRPKKELRREIRSFLEFFAIEPVSLDPFGIVRKIEHIMNLSKQRFKHFVAGVAPNLDDEQQANLIMGLSGAVSLNQIAKILRHYTELIKKTKSIQLAMVFQINIPFIERLGRALIAGTEALTSGWPIGDSIGCLVAANLIEKGKPREIEEDLLAARRRIAGREVYILKSRGPGGRIGKIGRGVEKLLKTKKIAKVITIDASAKLEGEKTGSIAEGVGVAVGGIGVDRAFIENITVEKGIPLDSIIIKMAPEEAIMPMSADILKTVDRVCELIEQSVKRTREKGAIAVVGVGNSCGIGNDRKAAERSKATVKKVLALLKRRAKKRRKFRLFY